MDQPVNQFFIINVSKQFLLRCEYNVNKSFLSLRSNCPSKTQKILA